MTYSVKYRKIGSIFWRKIQNIKGDGICVDPKNNMIPYRFFITEREERIEVSMHGMEFFFNSDRFLKTKTEMEKEVGHRIPIDPQ